MDIGPRIGITGIDEALLKLWRSTTSVFTSAGTRKASFSAIESRAMEKTESQPRASAPRLLVAIRLGQALA